MDLSESSESISTGGKMKSEDDLLEDHSTSSSEKQLSIFSLTLDKIQSKSGRSIGSMNIDEFLNSVWTTCDEFQASDEELTGNENGIEQTTLLRQRSLSVPTPFSGKTVDEVWAEIQHQNNNVVHAQQNHRRVSVTNNEVASLGEMTLEEFLVKTGVIKESYSSPPNLLPSQQDGHGMLENLNSNPNSGSFFSNGTCLDMNISIGQVMGCELMSNTPSNCVENGNALIRKGSSSVYHMFMEEPPSTKIGNGKRNSPSNVAGETNGKRKTGRLGSASMEVAIERRQRRMIKNRESAQRSRARKQAYTAELEIELKRVRDENESLKLALEEAKDYLKQEGSEHDWPTKKKFKTLRRTISSSW